MNNGKYKVLCLVGGGKFGCIPAKFLSYVSKQTADYIEATPDESIQKDLDDIDFLSGTSIGGILTCGYAAGNSFKHVSEVFNDRADDCFVKRTIAKISPLACPTYNSACLRSVISEIIGTKKLGQVKELYPNLGIIVPSLNITTDNYKVFDNFFPEAQDNKISLVDIAQMTSAAQTYFSGVNMTNIKKECGMPVVQDKSIKEDDGECIIDAGVIDVTSLLTCTTAIRGKKNIKFEDMDVLVIGVGDDRAEAHHNPITFNKYESYNVIELFINVIRPYLTFGNTMANLYWGKHMGFNSFRYWNPVQVTGDLDDTSDIPELCAKCDKYKDEFIDTWNNWLTK